MEFGAVAGLQRTASRSAAPATRVKQPTEHYSTAVLDHLESNLSIARACRACRGHPRLFAAERDHLGGVAGTRGRIHETSCSVVISARRE
jgi:hypothetical protein